MRRSDLHFDLPPELIAQQPAVPRDQARLLVYDRLSGSIEHARVAELGRFLPSSTTLVANNSKVRPGRLYGRCAGKPIEALLLEPVSEQTYRCLLGGRRIPLGQPITFYRDKERHEEIPLSGELLERQPGPGMSTYLIHLQSPGEPLEQAIDRYGQVPLPPYIHSPVASAEQYQTVYARELGSAAAPTAGLHFTPELIDQLRKQGFGWEEVTLHVGMGTFLPLREEELEKNALHSEQSYLPPELAGRLRPPVLAVGTTSTRTLESHWRDGRLQPGWQETDLFIYPGYVFHSVNLLLTNFHLPGSSLLALVAAFLGNHPSERRLVLSPEEMLAAWRRIYEEAIGQQYRFYSFGDAMLIR